MIHFKYIIKELFKGKLFNKEKISYGKKLLCYEKHNKKKKEDEKI